MYNQGSGYFWTNATRFNTCGTACTQELRCSSSSQYADEDAFVPHRRPPCGGTPLFDCSKHIFLLVCSPAGDSYLNLFTAFMQPSHRQWVLSWKLDLVRIFIAGVDQEDNSIDLCAPFKRAVLVITLVKQQMQQQQEN